MGDGEYYHIPLTAQMIYGMMGTRTLAGQTRFSDGADAQEFGGIHHFLNFFSRIAVADSDQGLGV